MLTKLERENTTAKQTAAERGATLTALFAGKQFSVGGFWRTVEFFHADPTNEYRLMVKFVGSASVPASKITAKNSTPRAAR